MTAKTDKIVSIRLHADDYLFLKRNGLNVSQLLKQAIKSNILLKKIRRERAPSQILSKENEFGLNSALFEEMKNFLSNDGALYEASSDFENITTSCAKLGFFAIAALIRWSLTNSSANDTISKMSEDNKNRFISQILYSTYSTLTLQSDCCMDSFDIMEENDSIYVKLTNVEELNKILQAVSPISLPIILDGVQVFSLAEHYLTYKNDFDMFCHSFQGEVISERCFLDYSRCFKKFDDVYSPEDLLRYNDSHEKHMTEKDVKALQKFFRCLDIVLDISELNKASLDKWRRKLQFVKIPKGVRRAYTAMSIPDTDLREWYNSTRIEHKPLFWLLAMTGSRIGPLLSFLGLPLEKRLSKLLVLDPEDTETQRNYGNHLKRSIIRIDIRDTSAGSKTNMFLYLPYSPESYDIVRFYSPYDYFKSQSMVFKSLTPNKLNEKRLSEDKRMDRYNPKTLRKFFSNACIFAEVPVPIAERLTSKQSTSILGKNYLDLDVGAACEYSRICDRLSEIVPFPEEFMAQWIPQK